MVVASYGNPALFPENEKPVNQVWCLLVNNNIQCCSMGSMGESLSVKRSDYERAKAIILKCKDESPVEYRAIILHSLNDVAPN